ncbi:DUF202 domain-containing protein [Ectothiorhodospiraceae bacterium 2226]|nr:DUF202 domain-containing protein [Ectothiorhodospiraceae bacterium 2226]
MSSLDDPRVFFAAERTLLAWNRTGLTLMAFGFVVERIGLFEELLRGESAARTLAFWAGLGFIGLGIAVNVLAVVQFLQVRRTLRPPEIPRGYWTYTGVAVNLGVGLLGVALVVYLVAAR